MAMFGNANQSFKVFSSEDAVTCKAVGGAIPGKRFVKLVAGGTFQVPNVALCGAGEAAFGVSAYDAADGDKFTVQQVNTWTVTAGANLVAPLRVQSDAAGKAIPLAAGVALGHLHQDAAINSDAAVRLSI